MGARKDGRNTHDDQEHRRVSRPLLSLLAGTYLFFLRMTFFFVILASSQGEVDSGGGVCNLPAPRDRLTRASADVHGPLAAYAADVFKAGRRAYPPDLSPAMNLNATDRALRMAAFH